MKLILAFFLVWATYKTGLHKFLLPDDFIFFIPMYGTIPMTNIGIGEFMNFMILVYAFYFYLMTLKNKEYYKNSFMRKSCVYLVGGPPGRGKTRFMTRFNRDFVESSENTKEKFIISSNYKNGYADVFYSSKDDFINLQKEIYLLALHTNFSVEEKIEIEKSFKGYFSYNNETKKFKAKIEKIKELGIKIHNITNGDEFYQYFHNRNFMSNFKGLEGQDLLSMIHQTRHSNQTLLLASQDTDNLDLDFRQISELEINMKEWFYGLFYGFELFQYLTTKFQNLDKSYTYKKMTKFPFFFLNQYLLFQYFEGFKYNYEGNQKRILKFINKIFKKNFYKIHIIKNPFEKGKLDYNTKFNVDKTHSVYKPGTYLDKVLEKYGEKMC